MPQKKNTTIRAASPPPPPPARSAPAPSLWNTVAEGFAFGTGSTVARNVIGSLWGSDPTPETKQPPIHTHTLTPSLPTIAECYWWRKVYEDCSQREDHPPCEEVLDQMEKACASHPPLHFG